MFTLFSLFALGFCVHLIFHCLLWVSVFTLHFIVCFGFLCSPYILLFALGFCVHLIFHCLLSEFTLYFIVCFRFLSSSVFHFCFVPVLYRIIPMLFFFTFLWSTLYSVVFTLYFCAVPYIPLSLLYISVLYHIFRYHCSIFLCCALYFILLALHFGTMGGSGGVVNSLDFCPASLKSLDCFYFRSVLSSAVTVNLRILHCQL